MKVTFLGTGAMQPTKERALQAILVLDRGENILVDCGEGTQRQMKIAGLKPTKLTRILISHFHADHVLGLGGLIRYLGANEFKGTLEIYGPKGIESFYHNIVHSAIFQEKIKVKLNQLHDGIIFENKHLKIEAVHLNHTCPCFGFLFVEKPRRKINIAYTSKFGLTRHPLLGQLQKGQDIVWKGKKIAAAKATTLVWGKKLSIILDTAVCKSCIDIAKDADLLICESTYLQTAKEKAFDYMHLTAKEAAAIAKKAGAKKLILTHFSQRYKDAREIEKEAKKVFKNTVCAHDFLSVEV